jgi:hypothetical protein
MYKRAIAEADDWSRLFAFQDTLGEQKGKIKLQEDFDKSGTKKSTDALPT